MAVAKFKTTPSYGKLLLLWNSTEQIVTDPEEDNSVPSGFQII